MQLTVADCLSVRQSDPANEARFGGTLRNWSTAWTTSARPHFWLWSYVTDFAAFLEPFPTYYFIAPDLRYFHAHNVSGMFMEGVYNTPGGDMSALKDYLMGRLLFNVSLDADALIADFLDAYYGPAAPFVRNYMDLMVGAMLSVPCDVWELSHNFLPVPPTGAGEELAPRAARTAAARQRPPRRADLSPGRLGHTAPAPPWLTPAVLLQACESFASARRVVSGGPAELLAHVGTASMSPTFVVLLRWDEVRAFADASKLTWPLAETKAAAFEAFAAVWNATGVLIESEGYCDLACFRQLVFPASSRGQG